MSDLFARVRPLVGDLLPQRTVAVLGSPAARVLVDYLGACGVQQWVTLGEHAWLDAAVARLRARLGAAYAPSVTVVASPAELEADLAVVVDDWALACDLPLTLPRLAICTPGRAFHFGGTGEPHPNPPQVGEGTVVGAPRSRSKFEIQPTPAGGGMSGAVVALVGERFAPHSGNMAVAAPCDPCAWGTMWDWQCAAPLMALWARALLLQGTPYAMPTWEGARAFAVGGGDDPTRAQWQDGWLPAHTLSPYRTPLVRRGTLLIAGLGSLGSVAAHALAPWVERLILVDPDQVEVANLVRQAYTREQVGMAKAVALAQNLGEQHAAPEIVPLVLALTDDEQVAAIIDEYAVDALLVTTGTQADFALARSAYAAALSHVVGRCYTRARYWEGIVVDASGTPSYGDVRRGVALGPTPAPTPEEIAAYGPVGELAELVGEPATALETGWAAWWLARLMGQMLQPPALREGWLLARLAAGATCFVGGLAVEAGEGGAAYGVRVPGEVHAWSAAEITGVRVNRAA